MEMHTPFAMEPLLVRLAILNYIYLEYIKSFMWLSYSFEVKVFYLVVCQSFIIIPPNNLIYNTCKTLNNLNHFN